MKITWKKKNSNITMVVNNIETENFISEESGYYVVYFNDREVCFSQTIEEAKEIILTLGGYIYN